VVWSPWTWDARELPRSLNLYPLLCPPLARFSIIALSMYIAVPSDVLHCVFQSRPGLDQVAYTDRIRRDDDIVERIHTRAPRPWPVFEFTARTQLPGCCLVTLTSLVGAVVSSTQTAYAPLPPSSKPALAPSVCAPSATRAFTQAAS
jgi:hypothetical protein